ncbi:MAG: stalk domain-containing protein, partial [Clostridia bacterium]|nr:stalk domain-containing protein [Clostridia bacterium]
AETKTAIGEKDGIKIELPVGNKYAKKNGQQMELDVPATIIEGRTLVPVRFIAESTGATVDWDATTRTVVISNQVSDGNGTTDDVKDEEVEENINNVQPTPNVQITSVDLGGEIVTIKNNGSESVNLQGYKIFSVEGEQSFVFSSYTLASGETVTVYSGKADGDIKWSGAYIWNNEGDSAELYDSNGNLVSKCEGI